MESLNKNWFAITLTAVVFGILGFLLGRQGKQQHMMFMKGGPDKMLGGKNMIMIKKEDFEFYLKKNSTTWSSILELAEQKQ